MYKSPPTLPTDPEHIPVENYHWTPQDKTALVLVSTGGGNSADNGRRCGHHPEGSNPQQ